MSQAVDKVYFVEKLHKEIDAFFYRKKSFVKKYSSKVKEALLRQARFRFFAKNASRFHLKKPQFLKKLGKLLPPSAY